MPTTLTFVMLNNMCVTLLTNYEFFRSLIGHLTSGILTMTAS